MFFQSREYSREAAGHISDYHAHSGAAESEPER
jgi:hypothetical protein